MIRTLIFGPPGTGKTTACLHCVGGWLKESSVDEISYITFMKAAARDACRRFGLKNPEDLWFRTLHSTAYRVLGYTKDRVVTPKWLGAFGEEIGMQMATSLEEQQLEEVAEAILRIRSQVGESEKPGEFYRSIYNLSRLYCQTVNALDAARVSPHDEAYRFIKWDGFKLETYAAFVEMYEAAKQRDGKVDFCDFLENILREEPELPPWRYAVIDESQDLSALQFAVADYLYKDCDEVVMGGDDDQAILGFCGSKAEEFLAYRKNSRVIDLTQTHRFGENIVRYAAQIADRIAIRHPKTIRGLNDATNEIRSEFTLDPDAVQKDSLILHRHVAGCNEVARRLISAGIPFLHERGVNPLGHVVDIKAWTAWRDICSGQKITADHFNYLLDRLPSMKSVDGEKIRLVIHGAKKKVAGMALDAIISQQDLPLFLADPLLQDVEEKRQPRFLDIPFADYYAALVSRGVNPLERPSTVITTIHGSKGREAKHVYLFTEAYPKALQNGGDDEHRVAYVGVTRTRGDLTLVHEPICGDWTRHYPYPEVDDVDGLSGSSVSGNREAREQGVPD
jgi:superfamily I DNA/RNA helicase